MFYNKAHENTWFTSKYHEGMLYSELPYEDLRIWVNIGAWYEA